MDVLYLDLWFALNLLCDYLLCLLTARAAGLRLKRPRYAFAALFGAAYACAACLPPLCFLSMPGWQLLSGALMGWIAFGCEREVLRCIVLFLAVSAAFGGALTALSGGRPLMLSLRDLLCAFLLCYGVGVLLFRCHSLFRSRRLREVTVEQQGKRARFSALLDTGNELRDPVSGAKVLVASPKALAGILEEYTALFYTLGPAQLQLLSSQIPVLAGRLRLLPYSAVGGKGLLPVFRPERLLIDGQEQRDYLIAVSPHTAGSDYEAIV